MTEAPDRPPRPQGFAAPLAHPAFRRIWLASLVSNLGLLVLGVGAAWGMTELTHSASKVALVQTATMLPVLFFALPGGAIADMFDRRKVAMCALLVSLAAAAALAVAAVSHQVTPAVLLGACFAVGTGMAAFTPAWQSSVREQVPPDLLPSAIALNSVSYNMARSIGPALGGVIVAAAGMGVTFAVSAGCFVPLLIVLGLWRRKAEVSRLPPERLGRAVQSGLRYILHAPAVRIMLVRTVLSGIVGSAILALMPLITRDLLGGGALTYGILLGALGLGAVMGAMALPRLRSRSARQLVGGGAGVIGTMLILIAASRFALLTALALLVIGAAWMVMLSTINVGIQLAAPRWVAARALAAYQAAISGGIALGAWLWGQVAAHGVSIAFLLAGGCGIALALLGRWLPVAEVEGNREPMGHTAPDIETALDITHRSGPVVIEMEYHVPSASAREFYGLMMEVQRTRNRSGAYGWSIARDISDTDIWIERYECPTWLDYLRQRDRVTDEEHRLHLRAMAFQTEGSGLRIRRMLERPFGSVRWRDDVIDTGTTDATPLTAG